ncbi:MAG: hypothetical protein C4297_13105 [Gemmataceae bacterium]
MPISISCNIAEGAKIAFQNGQYQVTGSATPTAPSTEVTALEYSINNGLPAAISPPYDPYRFSLSAADCPQVNENYTLTITGTDQESRHYSISRTFTRTA